MSTTSIDPRVETAPPSSTAGEVVASTPPSMPTRGLGLRAAVAELIFRALVRKLPIRVELPGGRRWGAGGQDAPTMTIARPAALFERLGRDANIGMGEAYQAGDWDSPDLADLLTVFASTLNAVPPALQSLRHRAQRVRAWRDSNTPVVSRRNTSAHYDLSNEMFAAFLDETMSYSAALFDAEESGEEAAGRADVLTRAQLRKIDAVLDYAGVVAGSDVMEIGTGWGALSIRAAQRGARVTSLTLSVEQQRLALERVRAAGVEDRVTILLQDYRQAVGRYDAVVSVEMIEAVGAEYWGTYFVTLDALLKPGGRVAVQSITMPDERMRVTRRAYTWINKYIFPGGLIPSIAAIEDTVARHTSLRITKRHDFGSDYARTLDFWRERFRTNWTASAADLDPAFIRTWDYYLAYCEAGFRTAYIDVSLLQLSRPESAEAAA
ncbi:MAG: cyclopropane-fatty-acyl-phospholipid synthase family protein [Mycobacteriales bacterium]